MSGQSLKQRDLTGRTTLEQLWAEAEGMGRVRIFASDVATPPNLYCCTIKFLTVSGTVLEAQSEFRQTLPDALKQAIAKAHEIKACFK